MSMGPVQLIVIGFPQPEFRGEVLAELERLKEADVVRVVDALAVYKDPDGDVAVLKWSDLSQEESVELGATVGALIGLGAAGEEGAALGAELGAAAGEDGILPEEEAWDVVEDIPNGSAAAIVLLEHRWAIGLREALASAGGFRISDGFISPIDLVAVGLLAADDPQALAAGGASEPGGAE